MLIYTDGLVEQSGQGADARVVGRPRLLAVHGARPLPELPAELADRLACPDPDEDVALLAIRIPAEGA
ncbi:PP2C family serine/threonine-protein phosphatase [Amycolatopsis eburnea]|uniref:SpoIIE family protein phosphatase n=1 Tax=Amycolatopsis eburnea TaxID=2267691 RepID=UPI0013157CEF|nr:SpoIIE family protein phosphatase [Amycolatopsis eburnea]